MRVIDRPVAEKSKSEIEKRMSTMGDYVKMSYLQRALKSGLDFDTKKFVLFKLAEVYEQRRMYLEAAKMVKAGAEINTTFKDKIKDFMRSVNLCVKANDFAEADRIFAQALALGSEREKQEMKESLREFYRAHARFCLSNDKRSYAKNAYEKLLSLETNPQSKKETQQQLLELYNRLGLIKNYYSLKDNINKAS